MRARALDVESERAQHFRKSVSLFLLGTVISPFSLWEAWFLVKPSETQRDQMKPSEAKRDQVKSSEIEGDRMKPNVS